MTDVVVTVPRKVWRVWLEEGDLPGQPWSGLESFFHLGGWPPKIIPGERVYIVANGRLRGYAPLVRVDNIAYGPRMKRFALVRHGGAVAVTIPEFIPGFRGYRYRWWQYADEAPFKDWDKA